MKNRRVLSLLIMILTSLLFSPNTFSENTTDAVYEVLATHGWSLPQDLFTDVVVTKNTTYLVWKPNTPESDSSDIPYKTTITLNIPGTQTETAQDLQDKGELPDEYPYFMVPLPTKTPVEDAAAADAIFETGDVAESLFTHSLDALLNNVIDKAIGALRLNVLYTVGKVVYSAAQENIEKKVRRKLRMI